MRGLARARSKSSSLNTIPNCWTLNESAPAWLRMASWTAALRPWMSETTAMIDVTATMLPSTVMNDRSFDAQIVESARPAASRKWLTGGCRRSGGLLPDLPDPGGFDPDGVSVGHGTDRGEGTGDHLVAGFQAAEDLEVLLAGDTHLDRHKLRPAVAHDEHALGFFSRLPGGQFGGRRHRLDHRPFAPRPPAAAIVLFADNLPRRIVVDQFAHGDGGNRHRGGGLPRRRSDVRGAGEARPDFWDVTVDRDHDLEVGRLP